MSVASDLIRDCRKMAGLTQAELGERLGLTQSAIAKLERVDSNPTVDTLARVLEETGHKLQLLAPSWGSVVYHALRENLAMTPDERLDSAVALYKWARDVALANS